MPDITRIDLSRYRLQKAKEMLVSAKRDMDAEDYKKHSAVIARFTLNYLKPEILPQEYSRLISNASLIRN